MSSLVRHYRYQKNILGNQSGQITVLTSLEGLLFLGLRFLYKVETKKVTIRLKY